LPPMLEERMRQEAERHGQPRAEFGPV